MIKPIGLKIQLDIKRPKVGSLDTSSMKIAQEKADVIAVGPNVEGIVSVGDTVLFKSWAVDIITDDGTDYFFIDAGSKGLCAVIK